MTNLSGATTSQVVNETCDRVRDYAETLTRYAPLPGGVISIADGNGLIAQAAFGHADVERGIRTSASHLFQIGSISKVFTSLLVNQLVEERVLGLDERIADVLDWVDLGRDAPPATIAQLLSHTAGVIVGADSLPDETAQVWSLRERAAIPPGSVHFHYSNVGFMLLGLAVSSRTGRSFPELVTKRLLKPMGMTSAIAAVTHASRPTLAVGYAPAREDQPWAPNDRLAPASWFEVATGDGNIAATAADMSRLVMLLLGDGDIAGDSVVSPGVIARMTMPIAQGGEPVEAFRGLPAVDESRYGLGINVERVGENACFTHGGGMVGHSTFLLVDKTAGFGIVILTNSNGDNLHAQQLARVAHADLVTRLPGLTPPELPNPDAQVRVDGPESLGLVGLGRFITVTADADAKPLTVTASDDDGTVIVEHGGQSGRLFRMLTGRYVTDHPELRRFHLDPVADADPPRWTHGPDLYVSVDETPEVFTTLRIVRRSGRLLLVAPGGVEAPSDEEELVEIDPGVFRIGSDAWLPERLVVGPIVNGRVISVARDGCVYSRTFTR
jgi:D-alanyl-D-alanine carboxypeptidase